MGGDRVTSPDVVINGVIWEMKSPQASDNKAIERNLRKACKQSPNIIFDSQRMKGASDAEIEKAPQIDLSAYQGDPSIVVYKS